MCVRESFFLLLMIIIVLNSKIFCCAENVQVQKCCPLDNEVFQVDCTPTNKSFSFYKENFDLVFGWCNTTSTRIKIYNSEFVVDNSTGKLVVSLNEQIQIYEIFEYCIDYFYGDALEAVVCVEDDIYYGDSLEATIFQVNTRGMIISIPFLLATIIVYILLPERNLHMKALMFYIGNLMLAYIILVTIQLGEQLEDTLCKVMGFLCLFLFTASIVWMNVICLDIFLTFSGFFGLRGHKKKENRRLVYYILYGFLFPSALILVTFLVNVYGDRKNNFYPGIGEGSCFLKNGLPHILYFQGPVGVLLLVNIVLFTLTAFKIRKAKQDTKVLKTAENRKSNENDNKNLLQSTQKVVMSLKFNLYLKLLFAMGINWSMETISWFFENYTSLPRWLWYITDFCNAIYGVFIFVLFACKKRHWKILKRKYYTLIGRPILGHSMSQTQQTRTTGSISDTQANGENIQLQSVRDNP